jgi:hypothetical protein
MRLVVLWLLAGTAMTLTCARLCGRSTEFRITLFAQPLVRTAPLLSA